MHRQVMPLRPIVAGAGMAVAVLAMAPAAQAGYLEIFGSPTYDPGAQTGFTNAAMQVEPGSCVNNTGTAVGCARKYDGGASLGHRALRWGGGGTPLTELDHLGTDASGYTEACALAVNDASTVAGYAYRYDGGDSLGERAVRWDGVGTAATELGHLGTFAGGHTFSRAYAVNNANTAVGRAAKYSGGNHMGYRAVRWYGGGTVATELGHLGTDEDGNTFAYACAVNDANTAVGCASKYVDGSYLARVAVRWDGGDTPATELGHLGTDAMGWTDSCAYAVNDSNTAVGFAWKHVGGDSQGDRAVRWDSGGTAATELGDLGTHPDGYTFARALAVNDANTAVGFADKYVDGTYLGRRAVRWDGGGTAATELGDLGTDASGCMKAHAIDVNDSNTAVGNAEKYVGGSFLGVRAVRWDGGGTAATELGNLGTDASGYTRSYAVAVNDAGIAVGNCLKYVNGSSLGGGAVMWGSDGVAVDLNTLIDPNSGWKLAQAYAISEDGLWIGGGGLFDPDGAGPLGAYSRLWVMEVPEPAGLLLSIGAAVPLLLKRRRSRRRSPELASGLALGALAILRRRRSA